MAMHSTMAMGPLVTGAKCSLHAPLSCYGTTLWRTAHIVRKLHMNNQIMSPQLARAEPKRSPASNWLSPTAHPSPAPHKTFQWENLPVTIFKRLKKGCICPVTADAADIYLANAVVVEQPAVSAPSSDVALGYGDTVAVESVDIIRNLNYDCCNRTSTYKSLPSDEDWSGVVTSEKVNVTVVKRTLKEDGNDDAGFVWTSWPLSSTSVTALSQVAASSGLSPGAQPQPDHSHSSLPNREMLQAIEKDMAMQWPRFFSSPHHYGNYHLQVVLENNYSGQLRIHRGIGPYAVELAKVRLLCHMRFASVQMRVLKITSHPEDGTVRIRWRIVGVPQLEAFKFWRWLPWMYRKTLSDSSRWLDGFSVLHVDKDGKIIRHCVERVIPDDEQDKVVSVGAQDNPLATVPT